jgi:hypothetical protein
MSPSVLSAASKACQQLIKHRRVALIQGMCSHTTTCLASVYYYISSVLILLCIQRPHTTKCLAPSYYYTRVLTPGDTRKALASYELAVQMDARSAIALLNCGNTLCDMGRSSEGVLMLIEALAAGAPPDLPLLLNVGVAARRAGIKLLVYAALSD